MIDKYIDKASSKEGKHYLSTGPRGEKDHSPDGERVCFHEPQIDSVENNAVMSPVVTASHPLPIIR